VRPGQAGDVEHDPASGRERLPGHRRAERAGGDRDPRLLGHAQHGDDDGLVRDPDHHVGLVGVQALTSPLGGDRPGVVARGRQRGRIGTDGVRADGLGEPLDEQCGLGHDDAFPDPMENYRALILHFWSTVQRR
jgi:hypothetical protein